MSLPQRPSPHALCPSSPLLFRAELFRKLADAGYLLSELHERGGDLDEIYRKYFEKAGGDENYDNRTEQHKEKRSLREKLLRRNR